MPSQRFNSRAAVARWGQTVRQNDESWPKKWRPGKKCDRKLSGNETLRNEVLEKVVERKIRMKNVERSNETG